MVCAHWICRFQRQCKSDTTWPNSLCRLYSRTIPSSGKHNYMQLPTMLVTNFSNTSGQLSAVYNSIKASSSRALCGVCEDTAVAKGGKESGALFLSMTVGGGR